MDEERTIRHLMAPEADDRWMDDALPRTLCGIEDDELDESDFVWWGDVPSCPACRAKVRSERWPQGVACNDQISGAISPEGIVIIKFGDGEIYLTPDQLTGLEDFARQLKSLHRMAGVSS